MTSKEYRVGNIGEKERSRLRMMGQVGWLWGRARRYCNYYQVPWWVRLTLFFSLWIGVSALLQAREQTSILLAARRLRRIDGKEEPEPYVIEFRGRARMIQRRSLFLALLLMFW